MRTKKAVAGVLVVGILAMLLVLPQSADAGGRQWNRGGHGNYRGHGNYHGRSHFGPGPFFGGLAVGALTGIVVGSIFAPPVYAAPPVVYPAPPVYQAPPPVVYQPAPVCSNYWVPTYWSGYQWVPGYWAQACR
jgi:hypothetical protein